MGTDPRLGEGLIALLAEVVESVVQGYKGQDGVFKIEVTPGVSFPEFEFFDEGCWSRYNRCCCGGIPGRQRHWYHREPESLEIRENQE